MTDAEVGELIERITRQVGETYYQALILTLEAVGMSEDEKRLFLDQFENNLRAIAKEI
jgi:hypothetical protein